MTRVLFLDDSPERHEYFTKKIVPILQMGYPEEDNPVYVKRVWTARDCIAALRDDPVYDLAMLDHDLGSTGEFEDVAGENTGSEVARFINIQLLPIQYPKRVLIHSWNEVGTKYMTELIQSVGIEVTAKRFKV